MHSIKQTFCKRFASWQITIDDEELFIGNRKTIPSKEWHIKWVIQKDEKGIFLEYYGIHSKKGHLHGRIYDTGEEEKLGVLKEYIAYSPSIPGDRERSTREFESYNKQMMRELKRKGLI